MIIVIRNSDGEALNLTNADTLSTIYDEEKPRLVVVKGGHKYVVINYSVAKLGKMPTQNKPVTLIEREWTQHY